MTADAQHRSPDVPPSSSSPPWSTPPASGEPPWVTPPATPAHHGDVTPRRRGQRVTALVASGALAIGLIGGVGIGRVTAPAAQVSGTSANGFGQGGPGGAAGPGGMGVPGGVPRQGSAQGGTGLQGGTGAQGLPSGPGAAAAPDQDGQSGQSSASPGTGSTAAPSQQDTTTT